MHKITRGPWTVTDAGVVKGPKKASCSDYVFEDAPIGHINFYPDGDVANPYVYWIGGYHSIWHQGDRVPSFEMAAAFALEMCVRMHGPAIDYHDDGCDLLTDIEAALACDPDIEDQTDADWVASESTVKTSELRAA